MPDTTDEELLAIVARLRREADELQAKVDDMRGRADQLEAMVTTRSLTRVPTSATLGRMDLGRDDESRALKISRGRTKGRRVAPEVKALWAVGLTPADAAELCGTTRDVLKQAWAKGRQFRPMRPAWADVLAKRGVPKSTWRTE